MHQQNQPVRKRPPPPSLSSLDSLNPYRASSASARSTPSLSLSTPSFLTPPILNKPLSSPPPQIEGEDYLSSRPHATQPQKRRHRRSKRLPSFLQSSKEKDHGASAVAIDNEGPNASDSESGDSRNTASDIGSPSRVPVALDTAKFTIRRQSTKSSLAPIETITRQIARGDFTATSKASNDAEPESVAVGSLRRFSKALASRFHHLPVKEADYGPSISSGIERIVTSGITRTDVDDFLNQKDDHTPPRAKSVSHGHAVQARVALETPTTITLRKASDTYFFVIAPKADRVPPKSDKVPVISQLAVESEEPSFSLMDFRSKRVCEPRKSLWYSLPLLSEQDDSMPSHEPPTPEPPAAKTDTSTTGLSLPIIQPRALPPDTALTFSSVHRTTPTSALDPPSIRGSISAVHKRRRTSTVHIHSRTSVHEIIWAEDENTNTSSSSSPSPTQPHTRRPSLVSSNITPKQPSHSVPASPGAKPVTIGKTPRSPEEAIFEWSWDAPTSPPARHPPVLDQPVVYSPIDIPPAPLESRTTRRLAKSKDSSVESFPPLLERNNTTDWRRSLVDINDPLGGRGPRWIPAIKRTEEAAAETSKLEGLDGDTGGYEHSDGLDGEEGGDGEKDKAKERRASNHTLAVARVKEKGRVGSCVGASAHKRVTWTRV